MPDVLCEHCTALCCRYIALPIDTPTTARDFDDIRWYLAHEGISVFVEDGDWYINLIARCKRLRPDHTCEIYATRPGICREYEADGCDYEGVDYDYDHYFSNEEQIEAFAKEYLRKRRQRRARARKAKPRPRIKKRPKRQAG